MRNISPLSLPWRAFGGESSGSPDEQRVLELFRSRAELKKAHTLLQEEHRRLEERMRQQQAATERLEKQLELLEQRLCSPGSAHSTLVFFQLRALWNAGAALLRAYAAELQEHYGEVEQRAHRAACNRRQFGERQRVETALHKAQRTMADATARVTQLETEIEGLTRPWHAVRRREAEAELATARTRHSAAAAVLQSAQSGFDAVLAAAEAPFPGLSVAARRAINLAVLAYAETLGASLSGTPLLHLAAQAASREEPPEGAWSRAQCDQLMTQVSAAMQSLAAPERPTGEIARRVAQLRNTARYESVDDAIPTVESVAPPARSRGREDAPGAGAVPNVLAAGTWGILRILLP